MEPTTLASVLDSPAWIGVIGTLAGGLIVGIFAVLSKYIDLQSESKKIALTKLEGLHASFMNYMVDIFEVHFAVLDGPSNNVELVELRDLVKGRILILLTALIPVQRIYVRQLNDAFENVLDAALVYTSIAGKYAKNPSQQNKDSLQNAFDKLHSSGSDAFDHLESYILRRRLAPGDTRWGLFSSSKSRDGTNQASTVNPPTDRT